MKKLNYILLVVLAIFLQSCGEELAEFNKDPGAVTDATLTLQLPSLLSGAAFNYGTNPGRVAGIWMQQLKGIDAQQLAHEVYLTPEDAMNNYWRTGLYAGTLKNAKVIIDQAGERPFYSGVAKIVMANELGLATSFFGDMPYSEAFQGDKNLKPKYDSQEYLLGVVFQLLEEGKAEVAGGGYQGGDLIYAGDADKWVKTANAFEARFRLMMGKKDAANYAKAATAAANAMSSNAENPTFKFGTALTANWSLAKFGQERPGTIGFNPNFVAMLEGDPRLEYYAEDASFFNTANEKLVWAKNDAAIPLVSYTEMLFIQAEVAARNGEDASGKLKDAILSNMELIGVAAEAAEAYADAASANASVESVVTEAYKAYYGYNFHQTWSNWRRTGYPALTPNVNAAQDFNPSRVIPVRYLYADSESTANTENVSAAKANQGGALLDAPLWVFK